MMSAHHPSNGLWPDPAPLLETLNRAAAGGVFPGGVLGLSLAGRDMVLPFGRLRYDGPVQPVMADTVYDLASLTKVLATTLLTMILVDQGRLNLDQPLVKWFGDDVPPDKKDINIRLILSHAAGFPAWQPLYRSLEGRPQGDRSRRTGRMILEEPLEYPPGEKSVYSDLGFILLGLLLETVGGDRLDRLFREWVARPLGLTRTGFRPDDDPRPPNDVAPTEDGPRWSGPLDGPRGEPRIGTKPGGVHDDNAAAMAGVAGHAGLFGTAGDVLRIMNELLRAARNEGSGLVSGETVRLFWRRALTAPGSSRALGFDTPAKGSSAGALLSPSSVGHTGYTGTSLWHDPVRDLTVVLLTNRVHPTARNLKIVGFRPDFHDLAARWRDKARDRS